MDVVEQVKRSAAAGRGNRALEVERPEVAINALTRLGAGETIVKTCEELGLSRDAVCALKKRNREWVEEERERQMVSAREVATALMQAAREEALSLRSDSEKRAKVGIKDLSVSAGIWLDKAERLSDRPDSRVEVTHTLPTLDACREAIEAARAEVAARGRVVDVD